MSEVLETENLYISIGCEEISLDYTPNKETGGKDVIKAVRFLEKHGITDETIALVIDSMISAFLESEKSGRVMKLMTEIPLSEYDFNYCD